MPTPEANLPAGGDPDYQPYQSGEFRWRLGLRPLDLANWIEICSRYDEDLAAKQEILAAHRSTVLAWLEGIEPEAGEVLAALLAHLDVHRPGLIARHHGAEGEEIENCRTGERWRVADIHPLDLAGRLVQEDLVLMVERGGSLVFGGGSVCFPNRWDLASKLGRPLADVHAPVARLNEQLAAPIDAFLARLSPEKSFWRLGWGVLDTPERYQAVDGTAPAPPQLPRAGDPAAGERLFLRVERETLRRFPDTGCVLFTIRTYLRPLSELATRPEDAARLSAALQALPDDVARYKQLVELAPAAVEWLHSISET